MKSEKSWKKISDENIRHIWKTTCPCYTKPDKAIISPDWYESNGTPICVECGEDMTYCYSQIFISNDSHAK
jgi:hypothetical protein